MQQTGYPGQSLRVRRPNGFDKMMLDNKELPNPKINYLTSADGVHCPQSRWSRCRRSWRPSRRPPPGGHRQSPIIAVRGATYLRLGLGKVTVDISAIKASE